MLLSSIDAVLRNVAFSSIALHVCSIGWTTEFVVLGSIGSIDKTLAVLSSIEVK